MWCCDRDKARKQPSVGACRPSGRTWYDPASFLSSSLSPHFLLLLFDPSTSPVTPHHLVGFPTAVLRSSHGLLSIAGKVVLFVGGTSLLGGLGPKSWATTASSNQWPWVSLPGFTLCQCSNVLPWIHPHLHPCPPHHPPNRVFVHSLKESRLTPICHRRGTGGTEIPGGGRGAASIPNDALSPPE